MTRREAIDWQERLFPRQLMRRYTEYGVPDPSNIYQTRVATLPGICMGVRSACNGAADPWEPSFLREVRNMLAARLATWEPWGQSGPTEDMDEAVRRMVIAAIAIADAELPGLEERDAARR